MNQSYTFQGLNYRFQQLAWFAGTEIDRLITSYGRSYGIRDYALAATFVELLDRLLSPLFFFPLRTTFKLWV